MGSNRFFPFPSDLNLWKMRRKQNTDEIAPLAICWDRVMLKKKKKIVNTNKQMNIIRWAMHICMSVGWYFFRFKSHISHYFVHVH